MLAEAEPATLTALHTVIVAGEACPLELVHRHVQRLSGCALFNEYGPTEAAVWCAVHRCDASVTNSVPIGRPSAHAVLAVVDPHGMLLPDGAVGELWVAGTGLARGYWKAPALTAARFIPNPHGRQAGARCYRTGDLAAANHRDELLFLGRIDGQVKIRGFRIELGEVEAVLREQASVAEAVAVVREDRPGLKYLAAYAVPRPGMALDPAALRAALERRLPHYMVPAALVPLAALPLSPNGKIDRKRLPRPSARQPYHAPRDPVEATLAQIWQQILGLERVGIHDHFFELGGSSTFAVLCVARAKQQGIHISATQFFEAPTIADMAEHHRRNPAGRSHHGES
jgi:acyl-CoA synthetase (AMP-forming)/AMP-acid ligase II